MLPTKVIEHLNCVAQSEGIINTNIQTVPASQHGDNLFGSLLSVTLSGKHRIDSTTTIDEKLDLVVKLSPPNELRREKYKLDNQFVREAFVYNELLPAFVEFQNNKGLPAEDSFLAFPKSYLAVADIKQNDFVLIMEDKKVQNFKMWPKDLAVRIDHCQAVVRTLARLHAISFAMKDQQPQRFKQFKNLHDLAMGLFLHDDSRHAVQSNFQTVIQFLDASREKAVMENVKSNYAQYFRNCVGKQDRFSVVAHGDCWGNNFMFTYDKETNEVDKLCLVDWQLTRYASPVLDVLHYVFTATDKQLRDEHYPSLLQLYYSTIAANIEKLGSDPQLLFSYDDFSQQLQTFGVYALVASPFMIQIALANPNDLNDLEKTDASEEKIEMFRNYNETSLMKFKKRVVDVVSDCIALGYFTKYDQCLVD